MGRPVNSNVPEDGYKSRRQFNETGSIAKSDFAVVADFDNTKKIALDPTSQPTNSTVTIKSPTTAGDITITLPSTSGTLVTTSTDNPSFGIIQPISGTSPTATVSADTLNLTSGDSSLTISGSSITNTIDLRVANITNTKISNFGITIDGGGTAITTGIKGYVSIPFSGTISSWTLLADQSGSIAIDVWKDVYANYPPTVADTIVGSEKPTITTATNSQDTNLTTWTTAVTAGDVIGFKVDSCTTITRVTLVVKVNRT